MKLTTPATTLPTTGTAFDAPRRCSVERPHGRWSSRPWGLAELRTYRREVLGRTDGLNSAQFDIA